MDYNDLLTAGQKREIILARMSQFAQEAYQVSLNQKTAEELGNAEELEKIAQALELLKIAIDVHQKELDSLPQE